MATDAKQAAAIAGKQQYALRKSLNQLLEEHGIASSPRVSFRIAPKHAATNILAKHEELRDSFRKTLQQCGIDGWELTSFESKPAEVAEATVCPQGTHWECRYIAGSIVCDCFPD